MRFDCKGSRPLTIRESAYAASLVSRLNSLALNVEMKRAEAGSDTGKPDDGTQPMSDDNPAREAGEKKPKTIDEERMMKDARIAKEEMKQLEEETRAEVLAAMELENTGNALDLTDDAIVTKMFNQIQKCVKVGSLARKGAAGEQLKQKLNPDGETIPLAPVDKTALIIPFQSWEYLGLLTPQSTKEARAVYADMEINFAHGGKVFERVYDPSAERYKFSTDAEYEEAVEKADAAAEARGMKVGERPFSYGQAPLEQGRDMTPEEHKDDLRRNGLYVFGMENSEERGGAVTIGLNALEKQSRRLGLPVFGHGSFLMRSHYPESMERNKRTVVVNGESEEVDIPGPPSDPDSLKMYNKANKRKMEAGRLWYKLFYDQEIEVQKLSLVLSGVATMEDAGDEARKEGVDREDKGQGFNLGVSEEDFDEQERKARESGNQEALAEVLSKRKQKQDAEEELAGLDQERRKRAEGITKEAREADQEAATGDPMVLAITEQGSRGGLFPGRVTPEYTQVQLDTKVGVVQKFEWMLKDPAEAEKKIIPGQEYQKIQIEDDQTWPLVKIGRTESWFKWSFDVKKRNIVAYTIIKHYFKNDLGNVSEWSDEQFPVDLLEKLGLQDSPETRLEVWDMIETTFNDVVDACPPWAQAYLSEELVDDDDTKQADFESATALEGTIASSGALEASKLKERVRLLGNDRDYASLMWHAYPSDDVEIMNKLDEHGNRNTNWAHEQLLRSVINLDSSEKENQIKEMRKSGQYVQSSYYWIGNYIDTVPSSPGSESSLMEVTIPGPRWMDRSEVIVGSSEAADVYQHWFIEHYQSKGVGNVGQLCTCVNMWTYASHTQHPYYVHAQGRGGVIQSVENKGVSGTNVSPLVFNVLTFHTLVHSNAEALEADRQAGICNDAGRLIVKVPGDNIWPFVYRGDDVRGDFRYGDRVVLIPPQKGNNPALIKAKKTAFEKLAERTGGVGIDMAIVQQIWYLPNDEKRTMLAKLDETKDKVLIAKLKKTSHITAVLWDQEVGYKNTTRNPDYMYYPDNKNTEALIYRSPHAVPDAFAETVVNLTKRAPATVTAPAEFFGPKFMDEEIDVEDESSTNKDYDKLGAENLERERILFQQRKAAKEALNQARKSKQAAASSSGL